MDNMHKHVDFNIYAEEMDADIECKIIIALNAISRNTFSSALSTNVLYSVLVIRSGRHEIDLCWFKAGKINFCVGV